MWLIAQMKAYSMLIKNWALICKLGHLCKGFFKKSMCTGFNALTICCVHSIKFIVKLQSSIL